MKRPFPSILLTAAALVGMATALPAAAQFAKPEDAIKYRKAAFTVMAAHFGRVAAMANGKMPFDAKAVADNAEIATAMSKLPYAGFVDGSDKGDTKALPAIWTDRAGFQAASKASDAAYDKLAVAAGSGNLEALTAAFAETGKTCGACHDKFRAKAN